MGSAVPNGNTWLIWHQVCLWGLGLPLPFLLVHSRDNSDRTQTGHVLGDPQHREATTVPDRELSPAAFILIRLLTHLAMLWGAAQHPKVRAPAAA